jgi:predicted nucleic acid-binding protein
VATRLLFDTSVYISVLRDEAFAQEFRPRYFRDILRTYFSSVVIQELLAGARTFRHRRQAAALYEPFERTGRIVTPSHSIWKEIGTIVAVLAERVPQFRDKLSRGLINDRLIALSGRSIGATVVTPTVKTFVSSNGSEFSIWRWSEGESALGRCHRRCHQQQSE